MSVDFPDPLRPNSPIRSPDSMTILVLSRSGKAPKITEISFIDNNGIKYL
jgi:hypothetical protein